MGLYDRDYMRAPRPNKVASRVFESGSSIVRGGGSGSRFVGRPTAEYCQTVFHQFPVHPQWALGGSIKLHRSQRDESFWSE